MKPDNQNGKKNSEISLDDIKPIIPDSDGTLSQMTTAAIQCFVVSVHRHILTVSKMLADLNKNPAQEIAKDPAIIIRGFSSTLGMRIMATYPALTSRNMLSEDSSIYQKAILAATVESVVGVPLEVRAASNTLKTIGKNVTNFANFSAATKVAFIPFEIRNLIGWWAISGDEKDLTKKAFYGGCAGILNSPLDSLGNMAMRFSDPEKNLIEVYSQAIKEIKFSNIVKGMPLRFLGNAGSAVILSQEATKIISEVINPLFQEVQAINSKNSKKDSQESRQKNPLEKFVEANVVEQKNSPITSIEKAKSNKLTERQNKEREG
jgi:hypothetical protein